MKEQQRKTVRDECAKKFISILESDQPLKWTKEWSTGNYTLPYNGQTGRKYNGINRFILMFQALEKGFSDPRYYTFKQVSELDGCKVRAGEKATAVEYWLMWDSKEKRSLTFSQYAQLRRDNSDRKEEEFRPYPKTAYIFNASQIDGLQPLPQMDRPPLEENRLADEVIKTMAENMEVRLIYGGDEAYYSPATDAVHLPPQEAFFSTDARIGTTLHELSHATSAPSRLDRPVVGYREDPNKYAYEELLAEISCTYVSAAIGANIPDSVIENHLAYVQSWLSQIKEDYSVLFNAIKEADKIADYMIEQGRVEVLREKLAIEAQMPKPVEGMSYEIWQLKDIPENRSIQFADYAFASLYRLTESRYDKVYEAPTTSDTDTLDKLHTKFNINHPADFKGHSMSMSDIVVLNDHGKRTGWYCDSFGFREVAGFCRAPQQSEKRGKAR